MNLADHADGDPDSPALIVTERPHDLLRRAVRTQPTRRGPAAQGWAAARRRGGAGAAEPPRVLRNHLGLSAFRPVLQRGEHPLHPRRGGLRHRRLRCQGGLHRRVDGRAGGADPGGEPRRRRPRRRRRCAARMAVIRRCLDRKRSRATDFGRVRDALLVGHHRAAQGRSAAATRGRPGVVGAEGAGVLAGPALRHDRRRACTCRRRRCITPRASTTRWRCTGSAPPRS